MLLANLPYAVSSFVRCTIAMFARVARGGEAEQDFEDGGSETLPILYLWKGHVEKS